MNYTAPLKPNCTAQSYNEPIVYTTSNLNLNFRSSNENLTIKSHEEIRMILEGVLEAMDPIWYVLYKDMNSYMMKRKKSKRIKDIVNRYLFS